MAIAFRLSAVDQVFVHLDWAGHFTGDHAVALRANDRRYFVPPHDRLPPEPVISPIAGGIAIHDVDCHFECILLNFRHAPVLLDILDRASGTILHTEALTCHPSLFLPFFDFACAERYPPHGGAPYRKPEMLAVFTHVHDADEMLTLWERHYARLTAHRHLYVIDHGADASPRPLLRAKTNIVPIPRGAADDANIAGFCHSFQRFLLTQYAWVIHVAADELLVHEQGPAALLTTLADTAPDTIVRPRHAYDLVHDHRREPPLDVARPVSLQRHHLRAAPAYAKPAIAATPTTWGPGFHACLNTNATVVDDALWMIHLSHVDLPAALRRRLAGRRAPARGLTDQFPPRTGGEETPAAVTDGFDAVWARAGIDMPGWMRGTF